MVYHFLEKYSAEALAAKAEFCFDIYYLSNKFEIFFK